MRILINSRTSRTRPGQTKVYDWHDTHHTYTAVRLTTGDLGRSIPGCRRPTT